MSDQNPDVARPAATSPIPAPPAPLPEPQGPWVRKVPRWKWIVLAIIFVPLSAGAPFLIHGGKREHRTTMYDGYGWPGVVGIWLFMIGLYVLIFWHQRREERRAEARGTLITDT